MFKIYKDHCETCYKVIPDDEPAWRGHDDEAYAARLEAAWAPYEAWKAQEKAYKEQPCLSGEMEDMTMEELDAYLDARLEPPGDSPTIDYPVRSRLRCSDCAEEVSVAELKAQNERWSEFGSTYADASREALAAWVTPRYCDGCGRRLITSTNRLTGRYVCNERCDKKAYRKSLLDKRNCMHCGESYQPSRRDAKFCSARCRTAAHRKKA